MVDVPTPRQKLMSAALAIAYIREQGGRVYRMQDTQVLCLTNSEELMGWLRERGGRLFKPYAAEPGLPEGAYRRARGGAYEWDVWLTALKVEGSIWEAAA